MYSFIKNESSIFKHNVMAFRNSPFSIRLTNLLRMGIICYVEFTAQKNEVFH